MKKTIKKLWYCTILVATFVVSANTAIAQNRIYDSDQFSEWSIIRNYRPKIDISYNVGYLSNSVNYVDRSTGTVRCFPLKGEIGVSDFVIVGDTVFFCGGCYSNQMSQGCFGFFVIPDLFFSGGSITYYPINIPNISSPYYSLIYSLEKIVVTTPPSGELHIVMVGSRYSLGAKEDLDIRSNIPRAIIDARRDALGDYSITYTIDSDNTYLYNDIIATDNFVVVSAAGTNDHSHNIFYYKHPTVAGDSYFTPLLTSPTNALVPFQTASSSSVNVQCGNIYLTKMEYDGFAAVCYSQDSSGINTTIVSVYDNPVNQPIMRFIIPPDICCQDIVYNPSQKSLYIIPTLRNVMCRTDMPFTFNSRIETADYRWLSIDNADNNKREIISGYNRSDFRKKYWLYDILDQEGCINYSETNSVFIEVYDFFDRYNQHIDNKDLHPTEIVRDIETFNLNIICGE